MRSSFKGNPKFIPNKASLVEEDKSPAPAKKPKAPLRHKPKESQREMVTDLDKTDIMNLADRGCLQVQLDAKQLECEKENEKFKQELESVHAELEENKKKLKMQEIALKSATAKNLKRGSEIRDKDKKIAVMEEERKSLTSKVDKLNADMAELKRREQAEFEVILHNFRVQPQCADYAGTSRAMQKFSEHLDKDITPEERKNSQDLKSAFENNLLKDTKISMSLAESHLFGLYLINEVIGQGTNVVMSNSPANIKHDLSI